MSKAAALLSYVYYFSFPAKMPEFITLKISRFNIKPIACRNADSVCAMDSLVCMEQSVHL